MESLIKRVLLDGISTPRLILRPLEITDAADMFAYTSNSETCKFLKWGPHTDISQTLDFIKKTLLGYDFPRDILWGIEDKTLQHLVGVIRIYDITESSASLSYILNQDATGKGYMTEAVRAAIDICFHSLNLKIVNAYFIDGNNASERVMKRAGMKKSESFEISQGLGTEDLVLLTKYTIHKDK